MSLQNIFTMIKADRYTEDGCEELNKAKKEIEDARKFYKPGEISEKTGLQKQPDGGWAPPNETQFGKVQQNKEGQWGVQTKLGKGSDFIKHKDEKEAKRALANYTAGYNRTGRNKEEPHSNEKRFLKHLNKETEQISKEYRAGRRAEHAAQFQNSGAGLPAANHFEAASKAAVTSKDKANLDSIKSYMDEEKATFKDALYTKAETLARKGANGNPDIESEQSMMKLAEAAGMGDSLKQYLKEEVNRTYEFGDSGSERTVNGAKKDFASAGSKTASPDKKVRIRPAGSESKPAESKPKDFNEKGLAQTYDFKEFNRDYGYEEVTVDMVTQPIGSSVDLRSASKKRKGADGETAEIVDRKTTSTGKIKYPQHGDEVILKFKDNSYGRYRFGLNGFRYVDNQTSLDDSTKEAIERNHKKEMESWNPPEGSRAYADIRHLV